MYLVSAQPFYKRKLIHNNAVTLKSSMVIISTNNSTVPYKKYFNIAIAILSTKSIALTIAHTHPSNSCTRTTTVVGKDRRLNLSVYTQTSDTTPRLGSIDCWTWTCTSWCVTWCSWYQRHTTARGRTSATLLWTRTRVIKVLIQEPPPWRWRHGVRILPACL